jgi:hypothetical protein
MSITAWFIQAFEAADAAGLNVPKETLKQTTRFLDSVSTPDHAGFGYQQPQPAPATTAAGLLCRTQVVGEIEAAPALKLGKEYLNKLPPSPNFKNLYYFYYATRVVNLDISDNTGWNKNMRALLIETQDWGADQEHAHEKGSWSPAGDAWGSQLGRIGQTALALLTLQACEGSYKLEKLVKDLKEAELAELWKDLATDNGFRASRSIRALAAAPTQAVPFVGAKLRPVPVANPKQTSRWLTDLTHNDSTVRQNAEKELAQLGEAAAPALRDSLKHKPTLDFRTRVDALLANLEGPISPECAQQLYGARCLELAGTPEAKKILETLASGNPDARLTKRAKDALSRMETRKAGGSAP